MHDDGRKSIVIGHLGDSGDFIKIKHLFNIFFEIQTKNQRLKYLSEQNLTFLQKKMKHCRAIKLIVFGNNSF